MQLGDLSVAEQWADPPAPQMATPGISDLGNSDAATEPTPSPVTLVVASTSQGGEDTCRALARRGRRYELVRHPLNVVCAFLDESISVERIIVCACVPEEIDVALRYFVATEYPTIRHYRITSQVQEHMTW